MTDRRGADLDSWIAQVSNAELVELEPFLAGQDSPSAATASSSDEHSA